MRGSRCSGDLGRAQKRRTARQQLSTASDALNRCVIPNLSTPLCPSTGAAGALSDCVIRPTILASRRKKGIGNEEGAEGAQRCCIWLWSR
jgi:hypothetical protein